jgi:hypothetical protein
MDKIISAVGIIVITGVLVSGLGILFAFPIKWCWNYAATYAFGLPEITWGKAWCLYFLAGSFIKSSLTASK